MNDQTQLTQPEARWKKNICGVSPCAHRARPLRDFDGKDHAGFAASLALGRGPTHPEILISVTLRQSLSDIIDTAVDSVRGSGGAVVSVRVDPTIRVIEDGNYLVRLFANLLDNALCDTHQTKVPLKSKAPSQAPGLPWRSGIPAAGLHVTTCHIWVTDSIG